MEKIILITGGARSGKSTFAEQYAEKLGKNQVLYLATSQIYDQEMAYRVKLHKERRPKTWRTIEAPFDAHNDLAKNVKPGDVVLFDCLTLYLSNYLCHPVNGNLTMDELITGFKKQIQYLLDMAKIKDFTLIFVSNEVGCGIVPENALARKYRDIAGLINQMVAQAAAEVYYVVAGIPMMIKGAKQ